MKDIKGIQEDVNTELVMQDKQISGVQSNLEDGHEKVMGAKKQLEKAFEKSKNQNKRMAIMCLGLFVIVVAIFLMLFGNPFGGGTTVIVPPKQEVAESSGSVDKASTQAIADIQRLQMLA